MNKINKSTRRELNKKICADTLEYVDELSLTSNLSPTIKLKIKSQEILFNHKKKYNKTIIQVVNQDVIKTTIDLHNTCINQKKIFLFLI
jgi:hypothetical protein